MYSHSHLSKQFIDVSIKLIKGQKNLPLKNNIIEVYICVYIVTLTIGSIFISISLAWP